LLFVFICCLQDCLGLGVDHPIPFALIILAVNKSILNDSTGFHFIVLVSNVSKRNSDLIRLKA